MYVCGPTVQSSPHIGHLRSALAYDIMRRWFAYRGYDVTFVRNVTDIDDKILIASDEDHAERGREEWWALAYRIELEFTAATRRSASSRRPTSRGRRRACSRCSSSSRGSSRAGTRTRRPTARATSTSTPRAGRRTASSPASPATTWRPPPTPTRAASATRATSPSGRGRKPAEPESGVLALAVGRGAPRLAHRVLGHGHPLPRHGVRHPRRRTRPALPAPRERARAVDGGRRRLRALLGAQRARQRRRAEDVEVARQLGLRRASSSTLASPLAVRYLLGAAHYRSTLDYAPGSLARGRGRGRPHPRVPRCASSAGSRGTRYAGVGQPVDPRRVRRGDGRRPRRAAGARRAARHGSRRQPGARRRGAARRRRAARPGRRDGRGARHRPARPALGAPDAAPAASALDASSPASSRTGRPPARRRTSLPPTASAPSSRRRASPSKTALPGRIGAWDMKGSSKPRAGAVRKGEGQAGRHRRPRPQGTRGQGPDPQGRGPRLARRGQAQGRRRSGSRPRAARAGRPGRSPGRASAPAPRAGHPAPRGARSRATSPRS